MQDRIAFGQSVSVNGVQMAAAVNTIANRGVRVSPSLIQGKATNNVGQTVGTDEAATRRVVSANAAHQMTQMMERVVDPDVGVAPGAQVPGYVVAGKTGTAQRVGAAVPAATTAPFDGLVRRLRPGRQPALHRLRRGAEPPQRRRWRLGRRAGVLQDHELTRCAPVRRSTDRARTPSQTSDHVEPAAAVGPTALGSGVGAR